MEEQKKIISIEQAHRLFAQQEIEDANLAEVCKAIVSDTAIVGDSSDYHNLAVELSRRGAYLNAFEIVEKGLSTYYYNIDLLSDAVYYGSCAGKYTECEKYAEVLIARPRSLWTWRAYTFMIDYYIDKADWTENEDTIVENLEKALKLSVMAQRILDNEERGYLAEYRIRMILSRYSKTKRDDTKGEESTKWEERAQKQRSKAEAALKRAIDSESFAAVQCCLRYADLKFEEQKFEETIEVCKKAFSYGETQPTAKLGYFHYLAALSFDAMIHKDNAFHDTERVEKCYQMYGTAISTLDRDKTTYLKNIALRMQNMESQSGIPS